MDKPGAERASLAEEHAVKGEEEVVKCQDAMAQTEPHECASEASGWRGAIGGQRQGGAKFSHHYVDEDWYLELSFDERADYRSSARSYGTRGQGLIADPVGLRSRPFREFRKNMLKRARQRNKWLAHGHISDAPDTQPVCGDWEHLEDFLEREKDDEWYCGAMQDKYIELMYRVPEQKRREREEKKAAEREGLGWARWKVEDVEREEWEKAGGKRYGYSGLGPLWAWRERGGRRRVEVDLRHVGV